MNCITLNEPYATAMIFGFKPFEDRGFEIKKGECIIQVGIKPALSRKKIIEYFNDIGAPITSDLFKIALDLDIKETDNFYIGDNGIEVKDNVDLRSKDYHMAECLFFRNKKANKKAPFLSSRMIGTVIFTHSEPVNNKKGLIRNYCKKSQLFTLKNSTFGISRLGQFDVCDNIINP
jgi:hypothetical protein